VKAVLLAAGRGARLGVETDACPKPLTNVNGRTCLDIALDALLNVCDDVIVVTGFLGNMIEAHVAEHWSHRPVRTVRNLAPEDGNLGSLAAARHALVGDAFIIANADHLFPPLFYKGHFPVEDAAPGSVMIACEKDRAIAADEMKVVERDGKLVRMSKALPAFDGAYIGATCVTAGASGAYWDAFDVISRNSDPKTASVEHVLDQLAHMPGAAPSLHWVKGLIWHEVDTPEDLSKARAERGA
jgi:choline kinase